MNLVMYIKNWFKWGTPVEAKDWPQLPIDIEINLLAEKYNVSVGKHVTWTDLNNLIIAMLKELDRKINDKL
jgi:hypothetical protein